MEQEKIYMTEAEEKHEENIARRNFDFSLRHEIIADKLVDDFIAAVDYVRNTDFCALNNFANYIRKDSVIDYENEKEGRSVFSQVFQIYSQKAEREHRNLDNSTMKREAMKQLFKQAFFFQRDLLRI